MSENNSKNKIVTIDKLKIGAINILNEPKNENYKGKFNSFAEYTLTRDFEEKVTSLAKLLDLDEVEYDEVVDAIKESDNKDLAFILFFTLFTKLRRNSSNYISELMDNHSGIFYNDEDEESYKIMKFIKIMYDFYMPHPNDFKRENIKKIKELFKEIPVFKQHSGVMNLYAEMICDYYESNLVDLETKDGKDEIKDALDKINCCIDIDNKKINILEAQKEKDENSTNKSKKTNEKKPYSKFYLNKGRLLILKGDIECGEEEIKKAIGLVPFGVERDITVRKYELQLARYVSIKNEKMLKELEKSRYDSLKQVSLLTTLLGFLLGSIQIFAEIKNPFTLGVLMLGYAGLVLTLLGIVLTGINFLYAKTKKTKISSFIFSGLIVIVGIVLFVVALIIVQENPNNYCTCVECLK